MVMVMVGRVKGMENKPMNKFQKVNSKLLALLGESK
jgi:hypothetical protein